MGFDTVSFVLARDTRAFYLVSGFLTDGNSGCSILPSVSWPSCPSCSSAFTKDHAMRVTSVTAGDCGLVGCDTLSRWLFSFRVYFVDESLYLTSGSPVGESSHRALTKYDLCSMLAGTVLGMAFLCHVTVLTQSLWTCTRKIWGSLWQGLTWRQTRVLIRPSDK